jgi:AraC family transcriptional regulator of arabinose operon
MVYYSDIYDCGTRFGVSKAGWNVSHPQDFVVDKPRGPEDCLFIHFTSPVRLNTEGGRITAPKDACILFTPGFHQYYCGTGKGFSHDWLHIHGDGLDAFLDSYSLPRNSVFYCRDTAFFASTVQSIIEELSLKMAKWRDAVDLLARMFVVRLYRELNPTPVVTPPAAPHEELLGILRLKMKARPEYPWTIDEMASRVHVSRSRFCVLYKKAFGRGAIDDLIGMRLQVARSLLAHGSQTVSRVAAASGFTNPAYFNRCFKKHTGITPGAWRNSLR